MMRHNGFSLIEVMVVISIIGILSSFAIPAYQSYVSKSRMSEIVLLTNELTKKSQLYYTLNRRWPLEPEFQAYANVTRTTYSNDIIEQTNVHGNRVQVLPRTSAFGHRSWIVYTLTDNGGSITGSYCDPSAPTAAELAKYLPDGEC